VRIVFLDRRVRRRVMGRHGGEVKRIRRKGKGVCGGEAGGEEGKGEKEREREKEKGC
jgi:hypothetical protein